MSENTLIDTKKIKRKVVESLEHLFLYEWSSPPDFEPQKQLDLLIVRNSSRKKRNPLKC